MDATFNSYHLDNPLAVAGEKNVFLNTWLASWQDWVNPELSYPPK